MDTQYLDALENLGAGQDALEWFATQPDPAAAWTACPDGSWMLRLLGGLSGPPDSPSRRRLVLAAADCAALTLPIYEAHRPDNPRPRAAIELAQRYGVGDETVTLSMLRTVSAGYTAHAAAAGTATHAAAAADAAVYASYIDNDVVRTSARCADIVRQYYPTPPTLAELRTARDKETR